MKIFFGKYGGNYYKVCKRAIFRLLSVMIIPILLFSIAAAGTGCLNTAAGTRNSLEESAEKQLNSNDNDAGENNNGQSQGSKGGSSNGKSGGTVQNEEKAGSSETGNDASSETEGQETAINSKPPQLRLEIIEGPQYAQDNNVCFYRIKAFAEGEPVPQIRFNRDDSDGAWGEYVVQVNLLEGESFTLVCGAGNSEGMAEASISIEWREPQENTEGTQAGSETGYSESPLQIIILM